MHILYIKMEKEIKKYIELKVNAEYARLLHSYKSPYLKYPHTMPARKTTLKIDKKIIERLLKENRKLLGDI